jgi:hypothetical protein
VFVLVAFLAVYIRGRSFIREHSMTTGVITKADGGGRGNFGPGIKYEFQVDGRIYLGSRTHSYLRYSIDDFVGKAFPVIYRKNWYGVEDMILIVPYDFEYYGHPFPDSLIWVLPYIK